MRSQRSRAPHVLRLTPYYFLGGGAQTRKELQYEPIGGMQVQIAQITEELDALGYRQTVVFPRRPGLGREMCRGQAIRLRLLRLPVAPIRTRSKGYIGLLVSWGLSLTLWCVRRRLWGRRRRFALIHFHCSELPWTFVFAPIAASILGLPLVLTVHCSAIATFHPETPLGRLLLGPARVAERLALRRADAVIVLTERIRRVYAEQALIADERVFVIPDGVRTRQFAATDEPPAQSPTVVYCGRFAPEKGWADFVAAVKLITAEGRRDVRFVMCGDGNQLAECRRAAARLGLAQMIDLPGHIDRDHVAALIRKAAIVVVPSRHEELGGTVLEALSTGRPVVATAVGGLPEVIDDGVTGLLVPPGSPEQIAGAVGRLLDDRELRERIGRAASEAALGYEAREVARRVGQLYHEVLAARTARTARTATTPATVVVGARVAAVQAKA